MDLNNRKRLEDFITRVDEIQNYSYFDDGENIVQIRCSTVNGEDKVEYSQPNKEKTDAILFNLRLFVQNKDDISIGRLSELCMDTEISDKWKKEYTAIRDNLNNKLDTMAAEGLMGTINYRDILDMYLFGKLGHRSEKDHSYKLYKKWVTNEDADKMLYNAFHTVIIWILDAVISISRISKSELK